MRNKSPIGYSMLKIIIFTIFGLSSVHSCDDAAVISCVTDIGKTLGLPENQLNGLSLFSTLNPTSDGQQELMCNVLKEYDYTSLSNCISAAGCSDKSIIMGTAPGLPSLTWQSVIDFMQGLCKPGCAHFASKNTELQQCGDLIIEMGMNLTCRGLGIVLKCYREATGSCVIIDAIIEKSLAASGLLDFADNCDNESVNAGTVDYNMEGDGETKDWLSAYDVVTDSSHMDNGQSGKCNGHPHKAQCCHDTTPTCFAELSQLLPFADGQVNGTKMFDLLLNLETDDEQDTICHATELFDYNSLVECVTTSGCANDSIFPNDMAHLPHVSWISLVELFQALCQHDCSDFGNKTEAIGQCSNDMNGHGNGDICKSLEWAFDCMRNVIGGCRVISTISEHIWTRNGMMGHISYACPELDTDIHFDYSGVDEVLITEGCSHSAVQSCFHDTALEIGLPVDDESPMDGMQIFYFIMPGNSGHQDYSCSVLQGFDYTSIKTCIESSGCNNNSILQPELEGQPGYPPVTWLSAVSLVESLCGPDCANLSAKNLAVKECDLTLQNVGQDNCGEVEQAYWCYRNAIGSCDVLELFTEDSLRRSTVVEIAMAICTDGNFNLSKGNEDASEDDCDKSDGNDVLDTTTANVIPEVVPHCDEAVAQACFAKITHESGLTNDKISILHLSNLAKPGNEPMQEHVCSSLENFDFSSLESCLAGSLCSDSNMFENVDEFTVTWMSAAEQAKSACQAVISCDEAAVGSCFAALVKDLELPSSQVSGFQLFSLLNPTGNEQQEQTCNVLRNHDISTVKYCVFTTGCADIITIPPGMGFPTITWLSLVDLLKDFCEPGCENIASINLELQQCGNSMGGGNTNICMGMEDMFKCYRDLIGSCQILVSITESGLKSSGIVDMANQMCPDVYNGLGISKRILREKTDEDWYKKIKKETNLFNIPARFLNKSSKLQRLLKAIKSN